MDKPQSDIPTVARESFKILMTIIVNNDFKLAFLQVKVLDRDKFMKPTDDQIMARQIWKLKKPLYGINHVSREYGFKLMKFSSTLIQLINGDKVFYHLITLGWLAARGFPYTCGLLFNHWD